MSSVSVHFILESVNFTLKSVKFTFSVKKSRIYSLTYLSVKFKDEGISIIVKV